MSAAAKKTRAASRPARARAAKTANARAKKFVPSPQLCRDLMALRPELLRHAYRFTHAREAAEDLVQDTIERAIRFQTSFQGGSNVRAWAHQILFSVFITRCRRRRRERVALEVLTNGPTAWTLPQHRPETIALSPPVARALEAVPLHFRAPIVLIDIEEMAYRDAAVLLGVPLGTIMSRLHRGRAMFAANMGGEPAELPAAA